MCERLTCKSKLKKHFIRRRDNQIILAAILAIVFIPLQLIAEAPGKAAVRSLTSETLFDGTQPVAALSSGFVHTSKAQTGVMPSYTQQTDDPGPLVAPNNGKMELVEDHLGDRIPDFSWIGYHHSSRPIPEVETVLVLEPSDEHIDDTQRIQAAIDEISAMAPNEYGHRGALLLKAGAYRVYGQLQIRASGVVLRGEGQHQQGTVVIAMGTSTRTLIDIRGTAGMEEISGTRTPVAETRIPAGTRRIRVQDPSGFQPGDYIIVHRAANDFWVEELGMHLFESPNVPWDPATYSFNWNRRVISVEGDTIVIDAPTVHAIEEQFGGGWIAKGDPSGRLEEVGVEHMRLVSDFNYHPRHRFDPDHSRNAIRMDRIVNSWVRNVTGVHFAYATVLLARQAQQVTVVDCANLDMVSPIQGGERYPFLINGHQNLVMRCYSETGRHDFVLQSRTPGPNAFVDCRAEKAFGVSEPHHRYSHGVLFDNVLVYGDRAGLWVVNRGRSGTGHGWAGAWTIIWNSGSKVMGVMDPPFARNMIIGHRPTERDEESLMTRKNWIENTSDIPVNRLEGHDILYLHRHSVVHPEGMVEPRSLFIQQLRDRLGDSAVEAITTQAQRDGDLEAITAHLKAMGETDGPELVGTDYEDVPGETFWLHGAYPNPFNPASRIVFELDTASTVQMSVYNVLGQQIRTNDLGYYHPGRHVAVFQAGDLPAGVYIISMKAAGRTQNIAVTLVK